MPRHPPDPVALRRHADALRRALRGRNVCLTMRFGDLMFALERREIGRAITMPYLDSDLPVTVAVADLVRLLDPPQRTRRAVSEARGRIRGR